jgi:hypothetical protein
VSLFGRTFLYEKRATEAIQRAKQKWANVEDVIASLEWAILHDPQVGRLLNERGLRGFVFPGARSVNEPDIDVIYEEGDFQITIHDLTFRDARSHYVGQG